MVIAKKLIGALALSAALLLTSAGKARADHAGLVRVSNSPNIYWVDAFGIRHHLPSMETVRHFFGNAPIVPISDWELRNLPDGQVLDLGTPPWEFDRQRDLLVVAQERQAQSHARAVAQGEFVSGRYTRVSASNGRQVVYAPAPGKRLGHSRRYDGPGRKRNLVCTENSSEVFYVDRFGTRHSMRHSDHRRYFGSARPSMISLEEMSEMPQGRAVSVHTPPEFFGAENRTARYR